MKFEIDELLMINKGFMDYFSGKMNLFQIREIVFVAEIYKENIVVAAFNGGNMASIPLHIAHEMQLSFKNFYKGKIVKA